MFDFICFYLTVSTLDVWITISSLANKDPNNNKALLFRQIELNWINAPLEDENDYIGLYLDSQPGADNTLPVSVHRLNGQSSGQIITDYYLPQIDFLNDTISTKEHEQNSYKFLPTNDFGQYAGEKEQANQQASASHHHVPQLWLQHRHINQQHQQQQQNQLGKVNRLFEECVGYCLAYHSRNKILAKNCLKTNPNWMLSSFQQIGTRSLPSLMIPGSHNSATYQKLLDKSVLNMINKYQLNQDESIFNQLVYGIRHLDLRVGYSKVKHRTEKFWIYHDIFRTEISVNEVLEEIKLFLDLTSHEIIIMDFHRFTVGFQNENLNIQRERHSKLIDLIFKHLGQYIVPSYLGQHAPINEYIGMGKRLLIGYANRGIILGSSGAGQQADGYMGLMKNSKQQIRDSDAAKQDQDELIFQTDVQNKVTNATTHQYQNINSNNNNEEPNIDVDKRVGTRIFNKLKTLKLVSNSFSKRSIDRSEQHQPNRLQSMRMSSSDDELNASIDVSRVALFFSPVRHLWPNKDSLDGLAQYMNETTCRKYFGELSSMMVELTPTVFGAIADKYDGNRRLAQSVNRQVNDWIRDRWLHCINIVASDFFLGNDLIRLSIYANKMRVLHRDVELNANSGQCIAFRKVEHLLDKSKIPIQFAFATHQFNHQVLKDSMSNSPAEFVSSLGPALSSHNRDDILTHTSSDGNQIYLRPLAPSLNTQSISRERRDSIVDNVSEGFTNIISSFKKLLSL